MNQHEPTVHIIVITCNGRRHLEKLLPSLATSNLCGAKVILVDNASNDGAAEYARKIFPGIEVFSQDVNTGFAAGNNIAMTAALKSGTKYAVLLNDDTVILDENWLRHSLKAVERDTSIGMLGFTVVDRLDGAVVCTRSLREVAHIPGCALLIRCSVLEHIGLFDEVYFAFAEEDDLEARAVAAGYALRAIDVPFYHYGGGTSPTHSRAGAYLVMRNAIRFSIKNRSWLKTLARILRLFDVACSPRPIYLDPKDGAHRRIRNSGNVLVNLGIFLKAVAWNLVALPTTLAIAKSDRRKIEFGGKRPRPPAAGM